MALFHHVDNMFTKDKPKNLVTYFDLFPSWSLIWLKLHDRTSHRAQSVECRYQVRDCNTNPLRKNWVIQELFVIHLLALVDLYI